ncbi:hypothetical protein BDW75DRAFT_240916 [Aspergillus navahoensis]
MICSLPFLSSSPTSASSHLPHKDRLVRLARRALPSAGVIASFITATNCGGATYAWDRHYPCPVRVVTTCDNRVFPVQLLFDREAVLLFVLVCCGGTVACISVSYISPFYNFARAETAQRTVPLVLFLIFGMLSNGYLMSHLGYYEPWYMSGAT